MFCPFCLDDLSVNRAHGDTACPTSGDEIPPLYRKFFRRGRCLVISTIGKTTHGKTDYLGALYLQLFSNSLANAWPNFSIMPLNNDSLTGVYGIMETLKKGELPEASPIGVFPKPTILHLTNSPFSSDMMLLFYDVGGEDLEDDRKIRRFAHYIKRSQFVLFLFALEQSGQDAEMKRLLTNYVNALSFLKDELRSQHLVIVLTKADKSVFQNLLTPHDYSLVDYVNQCSLDEVREPHAYVAQLHKVSRQLRHAFCNGLGLTSVDSHARQYFRSVSYTLVSSLGAEPEVVDGRRRIVSLHPRRVIDPLLLGFDRLDTGLTRIFRRMFR